MPAPSPPSTATGVAEHVTTASSPRLDLRVSPLWSESGSTWATVSVRNTARYELAKITLACTAFDADETALPIGDRTLLSPTEGLMPPGAARTVRILVASHERDLRSMSCEARAL
jgi:hypothetical protein